MSLKKCLYILKTVLYHLALMQFCYATEAQPAKVPLQTYNLILADLLLTDILGTILTSFEHRYTNIYYHEIDSRPITQQTLTRP